MDETILPLAETHTGNPYIEVKGESNGEGHAWNKVLLDSKWYNVDVCWIDTQGSVSDWFLKSDRHFTNNQHEFYNFNSSSSYYAASENH